VPAASARDGVHLHWEEKGSGDPILFIHEYAGDHRSWAGQVETFSSTHRCITYAARGYPPSDVPGEVSAYSQDHAVGDAVAVLDAAGAYTAHVVGLSMGGFTALHLALWHPERLRSAVAAGVGYGAQPERQEQFRRESLAIADAIDRDGMAKFAEGYAVGPARVQLQNKHPEVWRAFADALAAHDQVGAAMTMRGVQATRPSLYALAGELRAVRTPILILAGDEDEGSLEPSLMLKRTMPAAGLEVLARTGHTLNLEEPELFNQNVARLIQAVEAGTWTPRDPRALVGSITGIRTL
jgi:pimeloyl-ACP methyl ester carboxylesterase